MPYCGATGTIIHAPSLSVAASRVEPFSMKQGDSRPFLERKLKRENGQPFALLGCSVRFILSAQLGGPAIISRTCTIIDASSGWVRVVWTASDFATLDGVYFGEFEITFADAGKQSVPGRRWLRVIVHKDLE